MPIDVATQHSMEWSTDRDKILAAMLAFQNVRQTLPRTRTATVRTKNDGEYSYSYSDLTDLMKAAIPQLSELGLLFLQGTEVSAADSVDSIMLVTELNHVESGQYVRTYHPIPFARDNPQRTGAWESYIRRYAGYVLLGYASEDPDGDIEGLAAAELANTRNKYVPIFDRLCKKGDDQSGDELLEISNTLAEWQYQAIWRDLGTQQKAKVRDLLHHARLRKYGVDDKEPPSDKDQRRVDVRAAK